MPAKRIIISILVLLVLSAGVVAGVFLVRRNQEFREKASTSGGTATVSLSPASGSYNSPSTIPVTVSFNSNNQSISAVAVRVLIPYNTAAASAVVANNIVINPALLSSGDWSCPIHTVNQSGGNYQVDISCANLSLSGYNSGTSNTTLATFNIVVSSIPSGSYNPISLTFDPALTVVTLKSNGSDVLLTPSSIGSYTINGGSEAPAATVTPTTGSAPASTSTPTPTTGSGIGGSAATSTPTRRPTARPTTATSSATSSSLPDAGVSFPVILGIGLSIFLIISSVVLIL